MHIAFLNPQGNFDPADSHLTQHPDFGGQLVYVKQVALALANIGHRVDILTRQIVDPAWPEFASTFDAYPESPDVRIVRLPAGPEAFLRKELLWPHLVRDWVPNILAFYESQGKLPDAFTAHYGDGGVCGVLLEAKRGVPFTFTGHSLGAQKMDKLDASVENLAKLDAHYFFSRRIVAERLSMNRSAINITSTQQERFQQYGHHAYQGAVDVTNDQRFSVIPPGVNLKTFGSDARAPNEAAVYAHVEECLARDIAEERRDLPVIIASSRLDPKKNHITLVRAFAQTPALQERVNLIITSGGLDDPLRDDTQATPPERDVLLEIRDVVDAYALWGKISAFALRGQPALAATYRFFAQRPGSLFALTALYEPFGLAPLEAAAAGLPLIVTQNGGPSESLREGAFEYGVLVDPADPADIARGLLRIVGDHQAWAEFAKRGRQRVLDRYTWERTAQGYLTKIKEIVASPAARRPAMLLPIHPYFQKALPEHTIGLDTLKKLYFHGMAQTP